MSTRSELPIQTLRLSERDKAKLLWAIEQTNYQETEEDKRRLRVSCTNNEAILTLKTDGGGETRLAMLARNLSRWGAALVHGRYIHPDSRCVLCIQSNNGAWHSMPGTICHSRHIEGTIHEVGVTFDEPIDLSEFVVLSSSDETQYLRELADAVPRDEDTEVVQITHRVLVVDEYASDRKLFSHWLSQASLFVMTTSDARSALVQVQEQVFDLLVVEYKLGTNNGVELIKDLRENQFTAPIIAVSADASEEIQTKMLEAGADKFMEKPLDQKTLKKAVQGLIGIDATVETEPIFSTHQYDAEMRPLVTEFTRGLAKYIDELRDANAQNDYDTIEQISYRLKGSGKGYGFPPISEKATELLGCLSGDADKLDRIRQVTTELITILNRVKLG